MKKFDELKYWLNLNEYIKTALALSGLGIAIAGLMSLMKASILKDVSLVALIFLFIITLTQLVLGIRQMKINSKSRKEYKIKYQRQLNNLRRTIRS